MSDYVPLWPCLTNKPGAVKKHIDTCSMCGRKGGKVEWNKMYMPHTVRPYPSLVSDYFINPYYQCRYRDCMWKTPFEMNAQFVDIVPADEVRRAEEREAREEKKRKERRKPARLAAKAWREYMRGMEWEVEHWPEKLSPRPHDKYMAAINNESEGTR